MEDFTLIIMTEAQIELLNKFGTDCVCLDGTHGLNAYGFELITLLVIDDLRQGFPCAFMVSSRCDQLVLEIFFDEIKKKTGEIKCNVFMSDMADAFYNAWSSIMPLPEKRLFCAWHVDHAWRKNLKRIVSSEKKLATYKLLKCLLYEQDEDAFLVLMNATLEKLLEDPDTVDFGQYFSKYYTENVECWAYCKRLHSGINTNMHLERMHRTLKYTYLHGKNVKRLDKAINGIMLFLRDRLYDRLIIIHKGKLTRKLVDLRNRHKKSYNCNFICVKSPDSVNEYLVTSSDGKDMYVISKNKENCLCHLKCNECNECIHSYVCSCVDSAIRWNMCKHIHFLCMNKDEKHNAENLDIPKLDAFLSNNLVMNDDNEQDVLVNELCQQKEVEVSSLEKTKTDLKNRFFNLIDNLKTQEQCNLIQKGYLSLLATSNAIVNIDKSATFPLMECNPPNKNIVPQRKFVAKKKKRLSSDNIKMTFTQKDADNLTLPLILNFKNSKES
nr:uncharacterized protein LOC107447601 [Parasteatoda tepidariorum]